MKPGLPQGTRDFNATVLHKRYYIFDLIKKNFKLYGFEPLETPAFENIETLLGKYGEEGDKLIFKILNNGIDNPLKLDYFKENFQKVLEGKTVREITERALRYDLTIPFARYVAMNYGQLTMPYKRYQMQPVWRADRPQRGRYREFYQCDADIVGSYSLLNDSELAVLYHNVFEELKIPVEIKINNRKILSALSILCGGSQKMMDITMAIDKLDKIGIGKVKEELLTRGLTEDQVTLIERYLNLKGTNEELIGSIKEMFKEVPEGISGINELEYIISTSHIPNLRIDLTLARGLNYYTGAIFEVQAVGVQMGSIGGGGRYDDLTGLFGVKNVAGVGISFGVDRIYDVMEELSLFPENIEKGVDVIFFNLNEEAVKIAFKKCCELRNNGVSCILYHEQAKMDKQFKFATKKAIHFAVIIGEQELLEGSCLIKDLNTGTQKKVSLSELENFFKI